MNRWMPVIVGVAGYAQSGKDSTGDVFVSLGYEKRAFADKLRELAFALNPLLPQGDHDVISYVDALGLYGYERAKAEVWGFREFLKSLGNGARKFLGEDVWVKACLDPAPRHSVITDVRFANEADAIRRKAEEWGGSALILRVDRPGVQPESDFERDIHRIAVDEIVVNSGTLEDLRHMVLDVVGDHMVKTAGGV